MARVRRSGSRPLVASEPWYVNRMIGTRVTLRLRMSAHDAHYAGELVDGARMLALFGDLATELLIRLDGDEGLFRAYESVEFLAPVFAGRLHRGNGGARSHRQHEPARSASRRARSSPTCAATGSRRARPRCSSSPVVVARAMGTCVTPKELQRKPRELYMPGLPPGPAPMTEPIVTPPSRRGEVILTAAIVGAELTRAQTPHLPITPQEVADEAARCREAGAAVIHLHVRNADGSNTQSSERFAEVIDAIRRKCDCIIQPSTGGAVGMSIDERSGPLACKPGDGHAQLRHDQLRRRRLRQHARATSASSPRRSAPRAPCPSSSATRSGTWRRRWRSRRRGPSCKPLHFQFVLGVKGAIPAREDVVQYLRSLVPADATWAVAATGRFQQPMTELAMRLGGHARVGLEDNIYLGKGVLSEGSAPLVARAAAYARSIGRTPADPQSARQLLGPRRARDLTS